MGASINLENSSKLSSNSGVAERMNDRTYSPLVSPSISAIIIARNEERNLERCLSSLRWVREIVLVDAMSTDATVDIAARHGARIFRRPWPGYAEQRKYALEKATGEWVVALDADEELSTELVDEITAELRRVPGRVAGFDMPRMCHYLGAWIRHGEWYPDRQLRLFRRSEATVNMRYVHENFTVKGEVKSLAGHIYHYSFDGIGDHARRMRHYSALAAQILIKGNIRGSASKMLTEPFLRGWRNYIGRRGFLDGYRGLIITAMIVYYVARIHFELLLFRLNPSRL